MECTSPGDPYLVVDGVYLSSVWGWPLVGFAQESMERYSDQILRLLLFDERVLDGWEVPPDGIRDALVAGPLSRSRRSVVVPATADGVPDGAEDLEDQPDDDAEQPDPAEDAEVRVQRGADEQEDAEDDHEAVPPVLEGLTRLRCPVRADRNHLRADLARREDAIAGRRAGVDAPPCRDQPGTALRPVQRKGSRVASVSIAAVTGASSGSATEIVQRYVAGDTG